jgi:hypothetical protein
VVITIKIIIGGRITTGIICIRIKMGVTTIIIIRFTITVTTRITTLKITVTSGFTVVGIQGRQTHGRTHKMFFTHTTA